MKRFSWKSQVEKNCLKLLLKNVVLLTFLALEREGVR